MKDSLMVAFGVALTLAVIAAGIFLARVLLSKDPRAFNRTEASALGRALGSVRVGLVLVGWFAVVAVGVNGVLDLYLGRWGEARWYLASLAAFGTLPVLIALAGLPKLKHELSARTETGFWERKQLKSLMPPSQEELDRLRAESCDPSKSPLEQEVAASKHGFGAALRARDERLEAAVLKRQEREARAREEKAAQDREAAAKAAVRQAEQERVHRLEQMLEARLESLPSLDFSQARLYEAPPKVVLTTQLTKALWSEFKRHVADPVPTTAEAAGEVARAFKASVGNLEGVLIASGCAPEAVYSGNPWDGYCDLMMRHSDGASAAYRGLLFAETVPGLTAALFFAAALPRHWSWGHGLYDRDAELIIDADRLMVLLAHGLREAALGGEEVWPAPGVRLQRIDGGYEVACLAVQPGRGLTDISVRIRDGQAEALKARDVFIWGQGVLY